MAARDVAFGDGPELTTSAITNTLAHPPGYPLWIVLGHIASLVPAGSLAFRVNLTACAYHAVAVGLTYVTGFVLTRRVAAALFAAVILGIGSPLFVSWSLQAEVFSLNDLFAAAIVLLTLLWLAQPERYRLVVPLAALFGLGLSNQQTLVALAALPVWAACWSRRMAVGTAALAAVTFVVCFALPYAHTVAVSQHLAHWQLGAARTPGELLDLIDRRMFGGFNLVPGSVDRGGTPFERLWAIAAADGWPAIVMLAGVVTLAAGKRYRELGVALLVLAGPLIAFSAVANINVHDEMLRSVFVRFGLLSLVCLAPFAACVFATLEAVCERWHVSIAVPLVLLLAAIAGAFRLPALSLANEHGPRTLVRDVTNALPPHAIVMTAGDPIDGTIGYFLTIENWRPDVTQIAYGLLSYQPYARHLAETIAVPAGVTMPYAPQLRRDLLIYANRSRPFFVVGERGVHAPGPRYHPLVTGIVSEMIPNGVPEPVASHYRREAALQSAPGYGDVPEARWQTNGFGSTVREYYAGGFFSTGYDAERLGDKLAARYWYERARSYFNDPLIDARLRALL